MTATLDPGDLWLLADTDGRAHLYRIDLDGRPAELDMSARPRHGRGSLGHGYTGACEKSGDQDECNNGMCRAGLNHVRCLPACTSETHWDGIGGWQVSAEQKAAVLALLNGRKEPR